MRVMAHEMLLFNRRREEGHNDTYTRVSGLGAHHHHFCSDGEDDDSVLGAFSHLISIRITLRTVP